MALNAKYDLFGAGAQAAGADLSQLEVQQAQGQAQPAQTDAARLPGKEYGENVMDILKEEVGKVFVGVLEDAGVYKCTEEGRSAFAKFMETL